MAENNSVEYKNISDLSTLESVDQTAWAPVEIAGKEGKKVDLSKFADKDELDGKANKAQMSISAVSGDSTKKTIQLKEGTSADVVVDHQDLSQYYTKSDADAEFVSKTGYVVTDNNYTTSEKNKLDGIETGAQVNVQPDWNATAGSAAEILNKPAIPSSGYTRVTRDATIYQGEFVVPVNNRESVTAILAGGSYSTETVKLELSNDCDDAIVFLDGSSAIDGIAGVGCYRGNTKLRVILPIQRKVQEVNYLLKSTADGGSGAEIPSGWNEVALVSASVADRYEYEKIYPIDISTYHVSNLLVRIVADYAFVHYVDLPDN